MTKQRMILALAVSFVFIAGFLIPSVGHALEAQGGDACAGGETGHVRKTGGPENAGVSETLICNGTIWEVQADLSGPAGCPNIGDLCADGTVFAGWDPVRYEPLYIPTTDQGTTSQWKTSTGTNDIATDSTTDGRISKTACLGSGRSLGVKYRC